MNTGKKTDVRSNFAKHPLLLGALLLLCLLSLLLDMLIDRHETLDFASWFGFYAGFSFIACILLPIGARVLRRRLLRPADYYREEPRHE